MVSENKSRWKNEVIEWIKALLIAGAIVFLIRWFVFAPFIVDGFSMRPNFETGDRLIVNKLIYTIREPERGEVVVFLAPEQKDYIKRIIALPGETVKVLGDNVYINGKILDEPYISEMVRNALNQGTSYNTYDFQMTETGVTSVTVPEESYFVLGDNRPNSKDSRFHDVGFVHRSQIVGRADLVFWPLGQIKFVEHAEVEK